MDITIFKRLFEVRFLHEYYLSDRAQGGELFFSKSAAERQTFLEEQVKNGQYNILQDIHFEPTPDTDHLLAGRRLKFKDTVTGFVVGAEVTREDVNGIVRYKPVTPFEKGLRMSFFVRIKNPLFSSFTALRLRQTNALARYFFTNKGKGANSTPFVRLSENVPNFTAGKTYEPGELARFNGTLHEAVARTNNTNPANWVEVGAAGYVNENDRCVLGKRFRWLWTAAPQKVRFVLINEDFEEVKAIETAFTSNNQVKDLDFNRKDPAPGQTYGDRIPDGYYTIEAQGTLNSVSKKIYLHNELDADNPSASTQSGIRTQASLLGVIQIEVTDSQDGAPFIDDDGYIRRGLLPDGTPTHIIYEAPWLNRSVWWRYRSGRDKVLKALGAAQNHLTQNGKDLVSNTPIRFASLQKALATGLNLPNPTPHVLKPDPAGRYYADILISKVTNLIDEI